MVDVRRWLLLGLVSLGSAGLAGAQEGFWARYEARAAATQVNQPQWATPLNTTSPRVEQGFRADFSRQTAPGGATTWNDGGTKGLQFIPLPRMELELSPPPFSATRTRRCWMGLGMCRSG